MRSSKHLPIAFAAVFAVSFYAYGQLGGAQGIDVPYTGHIDDGSAALSDAAVDFQFKIYDAANALVACDVVDVEDVVVVSGRFALVIEDIAQACVVGKDVHLEVGVDAEQTGTPVPLAGRQRIFPALAAFTSGTGDFAATGNVTVGGKLIAGVVEKTCPDTFGCVCDPGTYIISGGVNCDPNKTVSRSFPNLAGNGWLGVCNESATDVAAVVILCARIQ